METPLRGEPWNRWEENVSVPNFTETQSSLGVMRSRSLTFWEVIQVLAVGRRQLWPPPCEGPRAPWVRLPAQLPGRRHECLDYLTALGLFGHQDEVTE